MYTPFRRYADKVDERGMVFVSYVHTLEGPEGYEWVLPDPMDVVLRPISAELERINDGERA